MGPGPSSAAEAHLRHFTQTKAKCSFIMSAAVLQQLGMLEAVETTDVACQCDDQETCNSPTSYCEKSKRAFTGAATSGYDYMQHHVTNTDLNKDIVALYQSKGKFVVNENCLLQLFPRKCPSCGCKLQMEKLTCGVLIVLQQQCLQCEYRNQWKSQVSASVPATAGHHLPAGTDVTAEAQKPARTDDSRSSNTVCEIVTFSDEESDATHDEEDGDEGDEGELTSDGEWNPAGDVLLAEELTENSEEESEEDDFNSPTGLKINELCTECGSFFSIQKRHICEHKIKPHCCNICGKRCVTEISLKNHSLIHEETYEHPCKYCHVTFKTRLDKLKHEQIHQDQKDPYKCPDCPKTFATNQERRVHLANHRTPREFKCGVCEMEFKDVHHLRRHSVVHTGLKPYKCSVCQRGFNQGSHLKSHMRLHTGERPYKCQQCDKCFNHNVSLKSHVERCHSSSSGRKRKVNERASDAGDADDKGDKKGADSECEHVEEPEDTEEEVQKERKHLPKKRRRCTGRPRGRPKRNPVSKSVLPDWRSNTKTVKSSSDEESEDEQSDRNVSYDSAEEAEDEEKESAKKTAGRPRRRPKNGSEETERKSYSRHSGGRRLGKSRGRPKKSGAV
ncbi:putative zinc finger protein 66 isoform X2 [Anabas testudineus]|uniref:putative zinc finger protein 66 isoform X2 n=1 Tax=Anabas testudineus TaxID=64144 RepID=UPI000E457708|nr:putative zinc finger protein 66 isoform X2 [Anabas testudineus]